MARPIRQLLAGAFPLLVRPPQEAGGPAAAPRRRRAGATARRLRELARADAAAAAAEVAGPPARLLQGEAFHGAADEDALLGDEGRREVPEPPSASGPLWARRMRGALATARASVSERVERTQGEALHGAADEDALLGDEGRHEALHGAADVGDNQAGFPVLLGDESGRSLPRRRDSVRSEGKRRNELTEADEKVEEAWMVEAKDAILKANSISHMFWAAEENIDQDWLGDVDELPGNIYRIAALGTLTEGLRDPNATPAEFYTDIVRIVGFITIFLIQICGPPLLIASVYFDWGVLRENDIRWGDWEPSFSDWAAIKTTKILSTLFLFVFSINGLYVILQEKQSWLKIYKTFRYLKHNTPNMDVRGEPFLILGPIVNSWVILLTSIASFTILGASFSPRNVLFDALGLLFLYNLDDIDGDLGFVSSDDWDGLRLGWIYREMVDKKYHIANEERSDYDEEDIGWTGRAVLKLYDSVSMLLLIASLVMPTVAFVTPFLAIVPEGFE